MLTIFDLMTMTFLISMLPVVELRLGLPYGIAIGLNYPLALISAILGNLLPVPFIILSGADGWALWLVALLLLAALFLLAVISYEKEKHLYRPLHP